MRKVKKDKLSKIKKASNIVLVSSFHSDEEEPWVYANRACYELVNDAKMHLAKHAVMRSI